MAQKSMDEVGQHIRIKFWWVPQQEEIDLIMDNAGGHGTDEAKLIYTTMLKNKYNVKVVWQTPQSPEFNLLDLGVWCSLQSMVELSHRKKCKSNRDALARTIEDVWESFPSSKFELVHNRWLKVLKIVCNTKGDNVKSDAFRGKSVVPEVNLESIDVYTGGNIDPAVDIDMEDDSDGNSTDSNVDD